MSIKPIQKLLDQKVASQHNGEHIVGVREMPPKSCFRFFAPSLPAGNEGVYVHKICAELLSEPF
jgi:hypothetical protein